MSVLHCTQIVKTVGEAESLRVCACLAELFDTSVDIAAVRVDFLYGFAFEGDTEPEHTVCGRMLRAYVYHIFLFFEKRVPFQYVAAVGGQFVARSLVFRHFIFHVQRVQGLVIVLAERMSFPVVPQEQPSEVRMSDELYAEEIVCLPLVEVRPFPEIVDRRYGCFVPVTVCHGEDYVFSGGGVFEVIYASESVFTPVHPGEAAQKVESAFVPQEFRQLPEIAGGNPVKPVTGIRPYGP